MRARLTRRNLLKTGLKGSLLAAAHSSRVRSPSFVWAQVQQGQPELQTISVLSPVQRQILSRAEDEIIPAQGDMPAAGEINVPQYIEVLLQDWPEVRTVVQAALDWLEKTSRSLGAGPAGAAVT